MLVIAFCIGKLYPTVPFGKEITSRTSPNIIDPVIALAAGAAGAYATLSPRVSAGLCWNCDCSPLWSAVMHQRTLRIAWSDRAGGGAFLHFSDKPDCYPDSGIACALAARLSARDKAARWSANATICTSPVMLIGLTVFLGISFQKALEREALRADAKRILKREIEKSGGAHFSDLSLQSVPKGTEISILVRAPWVIVPSSCARLQDTLRRGLGRQDVTFQHS